MTRQQFENLAAEILLVFFWLGPYAVAAVILIALAGKYL